MSGSVGGSSLVDKVRPVSKADHILGDFSAPIKIIEFSDLECPFCKTFHDTLHAVMQTYGSKTAWVYRHFPIDQLHSKARQEAQATECANALGGNDKFWAYVDKVFSVTPSNNGLDPALLPQIATQIGLDEAQFRSCLTSGQYADRVAADEADAKNAGGRGTPYSIVVADRGLSADMVSLLNSINQQYPSNPPLFQISKDKKMFSIGGAIPMQIMTKVLDELVKT